MFSRESKSGSVKRANEILKDSLISCSICPRKCRVDRTKGGKGYCRAGLDSVVYSYSPHHGEEPPLSGVRGSGTVFFSHCNMKCAYCQNYYFSQLDGGEEVSIEKLSTIMLHLQKTGCHNINLVTPTHFMPQILQALELALAEGLEIPVVYNTSGYESKEMIGLLNKIVDIYLVDMRYSDNAMAKRYSGAADYVGHNRASVEAMYEQVGDLVLDNNGIAEKGLIIRLLALPGDISGTIESLKFIKDSISKNTYLSIMSQYYPTFKAYDYKELSRAVTRDEYKNIVDGAHLLELNNGWVQDIPPEFDTRFLGTNIKQKMKEF